MTISAFMLLTLLVQAAALIALLVVGQSLSKNLLSIIDTRAMFDELRSREGVETYDFPPDKKEKIRQILAEPESAHKDGEN